MDIKKVVNEKNLLLLAQELFHGIDLQSKCNIQDRRPIKI